MKMFARIVSMTLLFLKCQVYWAQPLNIHLDNKPEMIGWSHGGMQTSDSGFIIASQEAWPNTHATLAKYDANFKNLLWKKTIINKPSCYIQIAEIRETKDHGFILVGYTNQIDQGDPIFLKFNACGEKEWACIYHDSIYMNQGGNMPTSIVQLDNGGYMVFSANHLERYDIYATNTVLILDSVMNLIDNYSFYETDFDKLRKHANGVDIASRMFIWDYDSSFNPVDTNAITTRLTPMSFHKDGSLKWFSPLVTIENNATSLVDIQRDSDGYIYSYGIEYVGDGAIRILAKHDTLGNFINSKKFGYQWNSSNWITIATMIATDDGGFIVTGSQENSKTGKNISRVEKIDKQGNVLDSLIFGDNAAFYEPKHVERTFDGHYVIFMNVYTGNFYTSHTYVVKVDQNLKIVNMDTVTQFHYDPYCGHKPTSDTIYLDASTTKVVEFKADSSMVYRYVHIKTGVAQEIAPRRMWLNSYPNPASDRIFVNLKEFGNHNDLELELYDMQGRKISTYTITKGTETYTILLDSYAKGSYAMHIKSEGKILAGNAVVVQ